MSLAKTIRRLARVVQAEARRNPEFAARLEAALAAHVATLPPPTPEAFAALDPPADPAPAPPSAPPQPRLNPVAMLGQAGAEGLAQALSAPGWSRDALLALAAEHNLDPANEADALEGAALIDLLVRQAAKRVARDRALFDY